jgi:predicted dienelactone hydrolase
MPLNATQQFIGSLQWAATDGIPWQLSLNGTACGSVCGKLSATKTMSDYVLVYTAPSALPASKTVSLVASSAADPSKTASATIRLTNGTVKLIPTKLALGFRCSTYHGRRKCFPDTQTATLTNTGASPLTISSITIGGADPAAFSQTNTCASPLGAGQSCDLNVSQRGSGSAVISIADSSLDSPQQLTVTSHPPGAAVSASVRNALAMQTTLATPAPTGSHVVGTRVASLGDGEYRDPYLSNGSTRELMVRFWYPAASTGACTPAEYTSAEVWSYLGTLLGVALPQVATHSCLDASVATGVHPVVVLTHGFTGTFTDYTYLAEDLASRGYVVASVNHTYEATATELSDGRLEKSVYGSYLGHYTRYDADSVAEAVNVRLRDLRSVLDKLTTLNQEPNGPFLGRLDLSRLALAGHSLGGLTTMHALALEPRFKVGIVLDGAVTPMAMPAIRQPVLTLLAGDGYSDPEECRMWTALQTAPLAVRLPGVEHIALSDAVWLAGTAVNTGPHDSGWVVSDTRRGVAAFLDAAFQGASTEQITGELKRSIPDALVTSGARPGCESGGASERGMPGS